MNFLTRHLRESGENYFEHFLFTFSIAFWLIGTGLILLCHAILPFSFISIASKNVKKINQVMQKRMDFLIERRSKKE
ncbi:MAG: hypothetical protein KGP29_03225 [Proteobacteria bacterium]|nr:hypothetical protein [Pseudomonadota bacterium]